MRVKGRKKTICMMILIMGILTMAGCGNSSAKTEKAEVQLSEEEKNMLGEWISTNEGEDSLGLSFKEDFTVSVTLNEQETEEGTWSMKEGEESSINAVISLEDVNISILNIVDGTFQAYYPTGEEGEWYYFECEKTE